MEEPGRKTGGVGRRERTPTDGAGQNLLPQERAICRIFEGFIFEATKRSGLGLPRCLLMAQSRHAQCADECPLSGVKRK
jgi:hypothetical protein